MLHVEEIPCFEGHNDTEADEHTGQHRPGDIAKYTLIKNFLFLECQFFNLQQCLVLHMTSA
ncbi:hypothetical protein D3C80_1787340 [compost metagenome]